MLNQKGQEEAPFTLLLAGVMILLLMTVIAPVLSDFQTYECEQRLINDLNSFSRELELAAALGESSRTVSLQLLDRNSSQSAALETAP